MRKWSVWLRGSLLVLQRWIDLSRRRLQSLTRELVTRLLAPEESRSASSPGTGYRVVMHPRLSSKIGILALLATLMLLGTLQTWRVFFPQRFVPDTVLNDGDQLVFFFATNGNSKDLTLVEFVNAARDSIRERARGAGLLYSTVAVSIAWNPSSGFDFVRKFGPFDEVSAGRRWMNSTANRYVSDQGGAQAVPQLAVFRESVKATRAPFEVSRPVEVVRVIGREDIQRWVKTGARTPTSTR